MLARDQTFLFFLKSFVFINGFKYITSIRGFVDTLKNGTIKDEKVAIRFLKIIDIESERLSLLINDILSLAAIENMDREINSKNKIDEIIYEVVDILHPKIEEKKIDVKVLADKNIMFLCNRNRIKQLLINLMDNAIKYTEEGHIQVECRKDNSVTPTNIMFVTE